MGEARRRAQAIRAGTAEPLAPAIRLREKVCLFEPDVYSAIERERGEFNDSHNASLDFDVYLNALLQVALERERQSREALVEAKRLADGVKAKETEKPAFAGAALLDTMAPAVERAAA